MTRISLVALAGLALVALVGLALVALVGLALVVWLVAARGGGASSPTASPEPSLALTPTGVSYCLPQFGDNGVAGGQADSGPFTFDLAIYTNPVLRSRQEADHPSRASDIPGVGFRATWIYTGPTLRLRPPSLWPSE